MVSRRKWAAPRVRLRRIGLALAQPRHQYVTGSGGNGEERVEAPLSGVVVALRAFLGQPKGLSSACGGWNQDQWSTDHRRVRHQPSQVRASTSRLTLSNWRAWHHRELRRKVPRVDGALTVQPSTCSVPPACTRRHRRCSHHRPAPTPPASAPCLPHWPYLAHIPGQRGGPSALPVPDEGLG